MGSRRKAESPWNCLLRTVALSGYGTRTGMRAGEVVPNMQKGRHGLGRIIRSGILTATALAKEEVAKVRAAGPWEAKVAPAAIPGAVHAALALSEWVAAQMDDTQATVIGNSMAAARLDTATAREIIEVSYRSSLAENIDRGWYVEIERTWGEVPDAIATWNDDAQGRILAGIWVENRRAKMPRSLVVSVEVKERGKGRLEASAAWIHNEDDSLEPLKTNLDLVRKQRTIMNEGDRLIGAVMRMHEQVAKPMVARKSENFSVDDSLNPRRLRSFNNSLRKAPMVSIAEFRPSWSTGFAGHPRTGLDALVRAAVRTSRREGHNLDWERGKLGSRWREAQRGAVIWIEHARRETESGEQGYVPGVRQAAELVLKACEQATGEMEPNSEGRLIELHGIEVPKAMWEALGEAGEPPGQEKLFEGGEGKSDRAWFVEIEKPARGEPRSMAVWERESDDGKMHGLAIWSNGENASEEQPLVVGWTMNDEQVLYSTARLGGKVRFDDEREIADLGRDLAVATMQGNGCVLDRVLGAIKIAVIDEYRTWVEATPAARTAWSEPRTNEGTHRGGAGEDGARSIFGIVRAGDPEIVDDARTRGAGPGTRGGGSGLTERQEVRAHWKRQVHGKGRKKRKTVLIRSYGRGPLPSDEQFVMKRMRRSDAGDMVASVEGGKSAERTHG